MTVRNQVVDTRKQHSHHGYTSQHPQHSSRRRSRDTGETSAQVMYDKKYAMDSDYREYYRDRPRGEFLTRGAALSSQQSAAAANVAARAAAVGQHPPEPTYGSVQGGGRRGGGGGQHDLTHAQYQQVAAGQHAAAAARLGRNVSSEKISTPRNPTILRKSKKIIFQLFFFINNVFSRTRCVCLLDVSCGGSDGGGGRSKCHCD